MKTLVGKVTSEEKNEIQTLFERKNGLIELAKIIPPDNEAMYEKLVKDMGKTSTEFQKWWNTMAAKYQWKGIENGNWEIDFNDGSIFLVSK
ncbi:MAG: CXXX repeat peptide modification system protein [Bacteroidales bacterium]|jgi:CXXX repeat modification system protein|nr:CXXX repeat peptide modification system protein [Bacteroidales bacterium]MDD2204601.1 CXXX repeat peptide modification system protein [Bacteroidales bacterium]MDD3151296.1 CXXX repeat peptide modification system protein [Bacteroidales bacterium]MDD3914368.1 CXXX repeat peptide modification system protein [Bacteroidales bacterium]MDD4633462.1 CXXX repeat peptide modification system protein [Bacteroidales bacterium]